MKRIEAIIQPFKLEAMKEAMEEHGVGGMTIQEVKGFGHQKGHTEIYRGSEYTVDFLPKLKVLIFVPDDRLDSTVAAIVMAAKTGRSRGDGKIFISEVNEAIHIRTGVTGDDAL